MKQRSTVCWAGLLTLCAVLGSCDSDEADPGDPPSGAATCGNGVVEADEACDQGSANSDTQPDACRSDCASPACGDGVTDADEECDDGPSNDDGDPLACSTSCELPLCGNGVLDADEDCDDGPLNSDDDPVACSTSCELPTCGDYVLDEHRGEQCDAAEIRGVYFNPEVYKADGSPYGNAWLKWYHVAEVRQQVQIELQQLKEQTGLTHLTYSASALFAFSWPQPTTAELDNMAAFLIDAQSAGFRVILGIGHPFVLPLEEEDPGAPKPFACGELECVPLEPGDDPLDPNIVMGCPDGSKRNIVNGFHLYWDMPECATTWVELFIASNSWFSAVVGGLRDRGADGALAYYQLKGHYGMPFAAEMNMFRDNEFYLEQAKHFVGETVPYLASISDVPIAAFIMPSHHFVIPDDSPVDYSFLDNFFEAVDIDDVGYVDIAFSVKVDIAEVLLRIGDENAGKLVMSDFKPGFFFSAGWTQQSVIEHHIAATQEHRIGGWWYWVYRDRTDGGAEEHIGLRALRETQNATEVDGAWKTEAVDALQTRGTPTCADLAGYSAGVLGCDSTCRHNTTGCIP